MEKTPKKIVKIDWIKKFWTYSGIKLSGILVLFNMMFIIIFVKELKKSISFSLFALIILVAVNTLVYLYNKTKFPNIKFYDDGFVVGKQTKMNEYKKLNYFFVKESGIFSFNNKNTFSKIIYKNSDGKWEKIDGSGYNKKAFSLFQEDFVKINYPRAMRNIENGGIEVFPFEQQKNIRQGYFLDIIPSDNVLQELNKIFEKSSKITITKEYIAFDDEIYNWNDYEVGISRDGVIFVKDLSGNVILGIGDEMAICCENLLVVLIEALNKNNKRR